jgi:hypothetical protein
MFLRALKENLVLLPLTANIQLLLRQAQRYLSTLWVALHQLRALVALTLLTQFLSL